MLLKFTLCITFLFFPFCSCLPTLWIIGEPLEYQLCSLTAEKVVDTSPEIPKSVSSIIEMFERSSSLELDSSQMKEIKTAFEEHESDFKPPDESVAKVIPANIIVKTEDSSEAETQRKEIKRTDSDKVTHDSSLVTDVDTEDNVSSRAHVKQIVEGIEAKVEHIPQQPVEDYTWQELAMKELDIKKVEIETKETSSEEITVLPKLDSGVLLDEKKEDSEEKVSVKELVKRHESMVKDQSLDLKQENVGQRQECDVKEMLLNDDEIISKDEPKVMTVETIDDLINEEHKLREQSEMSPLHFEADLKEPVKTFSDSYVQYEATDEWENVDTMEFDEPCKLPSPIEQQYSEYKIETAKIVEQDSITCQKHSDIDLPIDEHSTFNGNRVDESHYFMDITEDVEPKLVDDNELKDYQKEFEEVRIQKETLHQLDTDTMINVISKTDVEGKSETLKTVTFETALEPQMEQVSEIQPISKLNIDTEKAVEISLSEIADVRDNQIEMIEQEFSSENLVACEELEIELVEQLDSQETVKATECLVTEEFGLAEFKEEIVSETAEEEICTTKLAEPAGMLQEIKNVSEEVLTLKPTESKTSFEALRDITSDLEKEDVENDYLPDETSDIGFEISEKEIPPAVSETVPVCVETVNKNNFKVIQDDILKHATDNKHIQKDYKESKAPVFPIEQSYMTADHMSGKIVPPVPAVIDSSLEYAESPDEQFQDVFEEKTELEKEHDSYFLEDSRQMNNMKKERILLSRQESNIEITVAEYNEPFENEYDIEMQDGQYLDHSDSENEYYEREEIEDDHYKREDMVETESQTEHSILRTLQALENKEKVEAENGDKIQEATCTKTDKEESKAVISSSDTYAVEQALPSVKEQTETEMSVIHETNSLESCETQLIQTEEATLDQPIVDDESPMAETGLHGRVYSDIMEVASEEMEGEPVGFSVHIHDDEEYQTESEGRRKASFRLDSVDEENPDDLPLEKDDQIEDDATEDRAKVLEIIEGDEDEELNNIVQNDLDAPTSACPSETVEFDYGNIKATTSDYDLALNYVEKCEQPAPGPDNLIVTYNDDYDSDSKFEQKQIQSDESREEIFQMDDIIQDAEPEQELKRPSSPEKEKPVDEKVRADIKETFLDRTEEFIELSYDVIDVQGTDIGKVTIGSQGTLPSKSVKDLSGSQQNTDQSYDLANGYVSKDLQEEMEDIESDSIEDSEVDSLLEKRQHKSLEPEQESVKSSERPLSPTDYTLDVDMDESFIVEKKTSPETEGQMYTDVSQQIFIEQKIESSKFSLPKGKRGAGDGREFNEDVPPSPSEYTLVASYDQEKLKKALQQSPERLHHTPEKKPHQFSNLIYEDLMSVSMDESVLQRSLGLSTERNIMSASYDEEALKRVYDEEDIMVSSAEHVMQDSLIASSFEPDEYRQTGSVCSGREEDFSEVSDQGGMEKSYEGDIMTDSYERDSLHRSGGSEHEVSLADSVEQDTVELALEINKLTEQDLMCSSMDQEALQYSLGLHKDYMTSSLDQDALRQSLGLDQQRDVMNDSLEQALSPKSEDIMGSSDELKTSLGLGDQDLMSGIMDIDSLHRSLGLASSDSQMETSLESEAMQKSLGLDKVQSDVMYDSVEEEALKASLRDDEHRQTKEGEFDIMSRSMDQESLELSLGLERQEDVMMISMDQDVLRASLGLETIEECKVYDEHHENLDGGKNEIARLTSTIEEHDAEDLHAKGTYN